MREVTGDGHVITCGIVQVELARIEVEVSRGRYVPGRCFCPGTTDGNMVEIACADGAGGSAVEVHRGACGRECSGVGPAAADKVCGCTRDKCAAVQKVATYSQSNCSTVCDATGIVNFAIHNNMGT